MQGLSPQTGTRPMPQILSLAARVVDVTVVALIFVAFS